MKRLNLNEINSAIDEYHQDVEKVKRQKKVKNNSILRLSDSMLPVTRYTDKGVPVNIWTNNIDSNAWKQAEIISRFSFIHPKGISLMPDVHVGKDIPIGCVMPTLGAIVPAAVGTDIGCGMMAVRFDLKANRLPDDLKSVRLAIEEVVPLGNGAKFKINSDIVDSSWLKLEKDYKELCAKYPMLATSKPYNQLGTLGAGNHFIEVCTDKEGFVWIMLHSGSRGIGSNIGRYFIDKAKRRCDLNGTSIGGLGWFPDDDPLFKEYTNAVEWAQSFASENRKIMMERVIQIMEKTIGMQLNVLGSAVNCHHNYVAKEFHEGRDVWITRKGAIRAGLGEWGIIPGSMGSESFIVKGLGNGKSFCSCSHGAGRVMSRTEAMNKYTVADLRRQMSGVECKTSKSLVDEIPSAYKPIKQVMSNQSDLVEIVHTLKAVICIKGG